LDEICTMNSHFSQPRHVLPVMESFYTIQGEGFHQGKAAYFIRLGGCDVGCVWCDVKESWDAKKHPEYSIDEIIEKALAKHLRKIHQIPRSGQSQ